MDNNKKPIPLIPTMARRVCPICGKPSYSALGIHPQCSMSSASAKLRAAEKLASGSTIQKSGNWNNRRFGAGSK